MHQGRRERRQKLTSALEPWKSTNPLPGFLATNLVLLSELSIYTKSCSYIIFTWNCCFFFCFSWSSSTNHFYFQDSSSNIRCTAPSVAFPYVHLTCLCNLAPYWAICLPGVMLPTIQTGYLYTDWENIYPVSAACRMKLNSFEEAYYKIIQWHQNKRNF